MSVCVWVGGYILYVKVQVMEKELSKYRAKY